MLLVSLAPQKKIEHCHVCVLWPLPCRGLQIVTRSYHDVAYRITKFSESDTPEGPYPRRLGLLPQIPIRDWEQGKVATVQLSHWSRQIAASITGTV